jgi:hypothetical protein
VDPANGTDFQVYTYTVAAAGAFMDYNVPNAQVDQWHYIVVTYDAAAGVLRGYLDGVETHNYSPGPGTVLSGYYGFNLGTYRLADGRWFKGLIDEVSMWQRTLSPAAITQAYNLGSNGVSWLASVPKILAFTPNASPVGSFTLTWQSAANAKYSVEASSDLSDWSQTIMSNYTATTNTVAITISPTQPPPGNGCYDPGMTGASKRFYRVRWNP